MVYVVCGSWSTVHSLAPGEQSSHLTRPLFPGSVEKGRQFSGGFWFEVYGLRFTVYGL